MWLGEKEMKKQYIVNESNKRKREEFFDYVIKNYNLKVAYPFDNEEFVSSNFPFVIDFNDNLFWICNSITCCAISAQNHLIKTIDEFKKEINNEII